MESSADSVSPDDRLGEWREEMHPVLTRLQAFELPPDFPFDFSAASLAQLETITCDRIAVPVLVSRDVMGDFLESAMAYVGEALLRAGGGGWDWDADEDLPVVRPDAALRRPPITPLHLLGEALRRRTGTVLTDVHAELAAVVTDHQRRHPDWAPVKEVTPGVDDQEDETRPWLVTWLRRQEQAFPAWTAASGKPPDLWDFSVASLVTLEEVVRRRLPTEDAFDHPANRDFVDGAVWYFGDVIRRHKPAARWQYFPVEPEDSGALAPDQNPWVGRPFIEQTTRDGNATVPIFDLRHAVQKGTPGDLAGRLATLAG
jgi:hypothetical protein